MANYIYECPVCHNLVTLIMDMDSCPFHRELVGRCNNCNNGIDIYQDDWQEWAKEKEAKDGHQ